MALSPLPVSHIPHIQFGEPSLRASGPERGASISTLVETVSVSPIPPQPLLSLVRIPFSSPKSLPSTEAPCPKPVSPICHHPHPHYEEVPLFLLRPGSCQPPSDCIWTRESRFQPLTASSPLRLGERLESLRDTRVQFRSPVPQLCTLPSE